MSRYTGEAEAAGVLEAADWWKSRCLQSDGSVFSDGNLWSLGNLREFLRLFEQNAIEGSDRDFFDKLSEQLSDAAPAIRQLAAEVLWFYMLFPHRSIYGPKKKADQVAQVWATSGLPMQYPQWIEPKRLAGIGNVGVAYLTRRFEQIVFFVHAMVAWKSFTEAERSRLLTEDRPWQFVQWVDSLPNAARRAMRGAFLYLSFPDELERVVSSDHRKLMFAAFKSLLPADQVPAGSKPSALEIDRALSVIRGELEREYQTTELDFYRPPLEQRWSSVSIQATRRTIGSVIEKVLEPYGLELRQCGSKKNNLAACKPVDAQTGFWADPADATNKPMRWIVQIDLTEDEPVARVAEGNGLALLGNRRIAYANNTKQKSGAVAVRIVPAIKVDSDRFIFHEEWEWLLLLCFYPAMAQGSSGQLLDDFDPASGALTYMSNLQPYVFAGLITLNVEDAHFSTEVSGRRLAMTYAQATSALQALINIAPQGLD